MAYSYWAKLRIFAILHRDELGQNDGALQRDIKNFAKRMNF
jgi:hypothetical protein